MPKPRWCLLPLSIMLQHGAQLLRDPAPQRTVLSKLQRRRVFPNGSGWDVVNSKCSLVREHVAEDDKTRTGERKSAPVPSLGPKPKKKWTSLKALGAKCVPLGWND